MHRSFWAKLLGFQSLMNKRSFVAAALSAGIWLSLMVVPARAQIAAYVDAHGKLVYVNGDSPKPSRRSTISGQEAATLAAPETTVTLPAPISEAGTASPAPANARLEHIVQAAAVRHKLDPALVRAVISTESGWNTRAISDKGAMGLMQLIPTTAQRFGVADPFDPAQNVEGGTTYLKSLLDRYNGDLTKTLAAYNAGEKAVDESGGVPAYFETRRYVRKVTNTYFRLGSGLPSAVWSPPKEPVRRETAADGQIIFTNE